MPKKLINLENKLNYWNKRRRITKKKQKKQKHRKLKKTNSCISQRLRRKHRTDQRHKLYWTYNDNFIKLRKTLDNSIGFKSDPTGQVINLSTKTFCKSTFKLLNKNLNLVDPCVVFSFTFWIVKEESPSYFFTFIFIYFFIISLKFWHFYFLLFFLN